jgi:tRNA (mo5U34)-methyltransferase
MAEESLRVAAGNAVFEKRIQDMAASVTARFRYHSIELPDGSVLPGLQSIDHLRRRLELFGLEEDLRGKRVLDVGAWDGWFSFECERRGAQVVAVDCVALDTFLEARELLGSKIEYLTLDVTELSARNLGRFDIVLFFGVLYHLRHPLLGLEKCVELSTDRVLIESFVIEREERPITAVMEFYERSELGGQIDNWCGPSPECLVSMCRSAGFARVALKDITSQRASVVCHRRWPEPSADAVTEAPHLTSAANNRTYVAFFHPDKEEYICCYFKYSGQAPTADSVFIEVDGYGVPSLAVSPNGPDAWQVSCLRPPGLDSGRHEVRIRIGNGARSNPVEFFMLDASGARVETPPRDFPTEAPELCSAEFHASGDRRFAVNRAGALICYLRSPAESIGTPDISIEAGHARLRADVLSSLGKDVWQANILLDAAIPIGTPVRVRLGTSAWSNSYKTTHKTG